jgi:hypothetical protein
MRRSVTVIAVVVFGAAVLATYAAAGPPTKAPFDSPFTDTVTGICSFPLDVTGSFRGTETDFFDQSGETAGIRCDESTVSRLGKTAAEEPALKLSGAEGTERVRLVCSGDELPSSPARRQSEGCCLRWRGHGSTTSPAIFFAAG